MLYLHFDNYNFFCIYYLRHNNCTYVYFIPVNMANISFTMFYLHLKKLQHSIKVNIIRLNSSIRFEFRKTLADQLNFTKAASAFWWNFRWKSMGKCIYLRYYFFQFWRYIVKQLTIYKKLKIKMCEFQVNQILFSPSTGRLNHRQNQSYNNHGTSIHQ